MPTLHVSFWHARTQQGEAEQPDRVQTFVFEDAPQYKNTGDQAHLAPNEVRELLAALGLNEQQGNQLLETILQEQGIQRRRFNISEEQAGRVRNFFPNGW